MKNDIDFIIEMSNMILRKIFKYYTIIIIMPLSKAIKPCDLVPGRKYMIDIQWNLTNDLRIPNGYYLLGTFISSNYIRGRTYSYDSGLKVLLSRSRMETIFNVDGEKLIISSVNKFYEILYPTNNIVFQSYVLYQLPLDRKSVV
jgi:hypothetical protein